MTEKITESLKLISSAKTRRDKNKETIITRMIMKMTNELLQLLRIPRKNIVTITIILLTAKITIMMVM